MSPAPERRRGLLAVLPHLLTGTRLASVPFILMWINRGDFALAALAVGAAMLTDLLDGPLVRCFGTPSQAGAYFDVWADFLIILATFGGLPLAGVLPAWPLAPICLSFLLFIVSSRSRPGIYDPIGRNIGGILMAAGLLALLVQDFLVQEAIAWTAGIACAITMLGRLAFLLSRAR